MKNILVLGANSAMARALARRVAGPEVRLLLAGRNLKELEKNAADIEIIGRGPKPMVFGLDAQNTDTHEAFFLQVLAKAGSVEEAFLFIGQMYAQDAAQKDFHLAEEMMRVNYLGAVSILERIAAYLEDQKHGLIVAVSSVAGDRGRQSNYFYGSSKAGLSAYLQGLRNRMAHAGVHVMTVKPGFVDTPMTRGLKKGFLFVKPDAIAKGIVWAVSKKKNVVYLPWFWRWIMAVICLIPEGLFKKLKL